MIENLKIHVCRPVLDNVFFVSIADGKAYIFLYALVVLHTARGQQKDQQICNNINKCQMERNTSSAGSS